MPLRVIAGLSSWKFKDTKILFPLNYVPLRHLHQRFMTQRPWKRFRKLWPVQSWTLLLKYPIIFFVKESKVILCNEHSKFLTFNAPLLFKSCQCVLDLNGRIGKQSGFFSYHSFPNTKIFNSAICSSVVGHGNCMTASGVAIISVM